MGKQGIDKPASWETLLSPWSLDPPERWEWDGVYSSRPLKDSVRTLDA